MARAGFASFYSVAAAARTFGSLIVSELGLDEKLRSDGSVNRRVLHDLKKSRGNEFQTIPERVVFPRIPDAAEDVAVLSRAKSCVRMI